MYEAQNLPVANQPGETSTDAIEQCHGWRLGSSAARLVIAGKVSRHHVFNQCLHVITAARHREILYGADPQVTAGYASQNRAGFNPISHYRLTAADGSQCTGRGHS